MLLRFMVKQAAEKLKPVMTGLDKRARDEPTVQTQTKPKSMETQSQGARRAKSVSAQRARADQKRARPLPTSPQRDPGSSASARGPGACRSPQGRLGLAGSATVFRGADQFSCRVACAPSPR